MLTIEEFTTALTNMHKTKLQDLIEDVNDFDLKRIDDKFRTVGLSLNDEQLKALLLEMAGRKFPKPKRDTFLGRCLLAYTTKPLVGTE